jgi:hypothetical protein
MSTGFIDFRNTKISEGGGVPLPNGVFPGTVQSAQIVTSSKGSPQVEIKVEITEPDYAGSVRTEWINLQPSDLSKAEAHTQVWATAFLSVGFTPEQLVGQQIPHEEIPRILAGRDCVVEISERVKMDGGTAQRMRFLKPATYAIRRAAQDAAGGPQAAAPAAAPSAPTAQVVAAPSALPSPVAAPVAAPAPAFALPAAPAAPVAPAAFVAPAPAVAAPASAGLAALLGR